MKTTKFELRIKAKKFWKEKGYNAPVGIALDEFIAYLYDHKHIGGIFDLEKKDDLEDIKWYIKELQGMLDLAKRYE